MSIAICKGPDGHGADHAPLLLYAGDGDEAMQAEQGPDGYTVTRMRFDGVMDSLGVAEAEVDESPICAACGCCIDHWDHANADLLNAAR